MRVLYSTDCDCLITLCEGGVDFCRGLQVAHITICRAREVTAWPASDRYQDLVETAFFLLEHLKIFVVASVSGYQRPTLPCRCEISEVCDAGQKSFLQLVLIMLEIAKQLGHQDVTRWPAAVTNIEEVDPALLVLLEMNVASLLGHYSIPQ